MKKDNSEKGKSKKKNPKAKTLQKDDSEKEKLINDNYEKNNSENGQIYTGRFRKTTKDKSEQGQTRKGNN